MSRYNISFINQSTIVSDDEARIVMDALQKQVTNDFAPIWGINVDLSFNNYDDKYWQLLILDTTDQAGKLGYHDTTGNGLPLGKVFAATDKQYNSEWSVSASHELLEMLVDPDISQYVNKYNEDGSTVTYVKEVCDACEEDDDGYRIDGILVSDFVYPSWFQQFNSLGTRFDFMNKIKKPFQLSPGGIININNGNGWIQIAGNTVLSYKMRAPIGSRRERRRIQRNHWLNSTADTSNKG